MDDKTKQTLMYAGVVVAVIMFANMGGGGTFSVKSAAANEPDPAPAAAVAKPSRPTPARDVPSAAHPDRTVTTRSGEPSIITYKSGEQKIEQSIADARGKLPYFWEHVAHPAPYEKTFTLKVAFPVTRSDGAKGREHIWVSGIARNGATISGRLDNDPDMMPGMHAGDAITFSEDMVTDWGFRRSGKLIGFYSTRVMLDDAPPAEAEYIRAMLGENP